MTRRALAILLPCALAAAAAMMAQNHNPQPAPAPEKSTEPANPLQLGARLVAGLNATPGCLGTEVAQTQSGKAVIFARGRGAPLPVKYNPGAGAFEFQPR